MNTTNDGSRTQDASGKLMTTMRAEHELLLCIARRDLDEGRELELRRLLGTPLNWNYLLSAARQHRLIPLLYRHLNAVRFAVPHAELDLIKRESVENCQSVLHLIGCLTKLLKVFQENRIPVLVFKGPILAQLAYGENSVRPAGDVDILIKRANFGRAKELLESLKYQMVPPLTAAQQAAHLNFHCEIQFMRDNWFTVVDLHWSLTPKAFPIALNADDVIARAQPVSIGGANANTFCAEDLILFQCVHGAKHYWSRLEWISSLAEVIRNQEFIDWDVLINRSRDARAVKILALGLSLAKQIGDVAIPERVFNEIDATGSMQIIATDTLNTLFDERETEYLSVRAIRKNLKIMDRKRDVFASTLRAVFVPTLSDWEGLSLPRSMPWLYYVYRPLRLMKTYVVSLFRNLFLKDRHTDPLAKPVAEQLSGGVID